MSILKAIAKMKKLTKQQLQSWEFHTRKMWKDGKLSSTQVRALTKAGFVFEVPDTASENKKILLKMAKEGKSRPNSKKTKLGSALSRYLKKSGECYDPEFEKVLRKSNPSWFISRSDIVVENKAKLLEMARDGEPRPHWKTKLGQGLYHYWGKTSDCYDLEFEKALRKANPLWFITQSDIVNQKKKTLLKIARDGNPRPSCKKTKLGKSLMSYLSKSQCSYDPVFDAKIRKLRPDWFKK